MNLEKLLPLIEGMPVYRQLTGELRSKTANLKLGVIDAAKPYLLAALYRDQKRPLLIITGHPENAHKLHEQLTAWLQSVPIRLLPEPDTIPYQRVAADASTELERLQVLSTLSHLSADSAVPPIIVASASSLLPKVISHKDFTANSFVIKSGTDVEPLQLMSRLTSLGYSVESTVEVPGTAGRRGGIIDIYPVNSDLPVRLEFFGNNVESIRLFEPTSQRSTTPVTSISIEPTTELLAPRLYDKAKLSAIVERLDLSNCTAEVREEMEHELALLLEKQVTPDAQFYSPLFNEDSLLSYFSDNTLVIVDEPSVIESVTNEFHSDAGELREQKIGQGELPNNFPAPYFTWPELEPNLARMQALRVTSLGEVAAGEKFYQLSFTPAPSYAGQLTAFVQKLKQRMGQQQTVVVVSNQADRLSELLLEDDVLIPVLPELKDVPQPGSLILLHDFLAEGWVMGADTHLFTDKEIFGFTRLRRVHKKRPVAYHKFLAELTPGDFVVHVEHGVASFVGVINKQNNGIDREYLILQYAAGDRLYVPTEQIDRVSRYIGAKETPPVLTRLGTMEWIKTKKRVQEDTEKIAKELLALYATREVVNGFAFSPDTPWQNEMENAFPYVETPDQLEVLKDVKEDMEKTKPMDRLVCGDVGYGKTEIAVRAAFKAVMDNKQVAVLVPTTVLAQQHFITFTERMSAFPVKIEVLSRFRTPKEQKAVVEKLAAGDVDIVIGTHRLLQKDIKFKDLGLLVIDEEQRFGVAHKEYLKKLRQELSVLALSATPIPRTLHMSLVGVRDMSTIDTPPEDRLPIKTYVAPYNDQIVREAILKELERDGQVFFVHNRVQSIAWVAKKVQDLVPEAKVIVGHGQMSEGQLEDVMAEFTGGKANVLVCTTIIESGLDMPRANTLIISNADKLGLTQLYQLRGRIGRGTELGYAYFLYDKGKRLTPTAEKRLQTIFEATELGSGFNIAMKDLEIRGAGNLLGIKQSGHINAVGFTLYVQLLAQAVEELKSQQAGAAPKPPKLPPPSVDLPLTAFIPEGYVTDLPTRLGFYQKLSKVEDLTDVDTIAQEFADRFGKLPIEVENLLYMLRIKLLAAKAAVQSVALSGGEIMLRLIEGMTFNPQQRKIVRPPGVHLGSSQVRLKMDTDRWQELVRQVLVRLAYK